MSGVHAVHVGGERLAACGPCRTALRRRSAARRSRRSACAAPRGIRRPRSKAPPTPCTGSTITAAVSVPMIRAMRGDVAARHELHVERRAREAVPLLGRAPGDGAGSGGAAVEALPSTATTLRAARCIVNASFSAFSFASAPVLTKNTLFRPRPREARSACSPRARARPSARRCSGRSSRAPGRSSAACQRGMAVARAPPPRGRRRDRAPGGRRACAATRPDASTTSSGYCAIHRRQGSSGGRRPVDAVGIHAFFRSSPAPAPSGPRSLRAAEHAVHPLHGAAGGALGQVVDHAHHGDACGRSLTPESSRVVAGDDVLDARRFAADAHEDATGRSTRAARRRARASSRGSCELSPAPSRGCRARTDRSAARRRSRASTPEAALRERRDLRRVPVRQRVVGIQVAVPLRMMRALDGLAAGAGAAGDAASRTARGSTRPSDSSGTLASRIGGGEAAGMRRRAAWAARSGARAPRR